MLAVVLAVRFLSELCLLAVLGWWGWSAADGLAGWVLAVAAPAAAAVVWGLVVSPKPRVTLPLGLRVCVEVALFALAGLGLSSLTTPAWGVALLAADLSVLAMLAWLGHRSGAGASPYGVQVFGGLG